MVALELLGVMNKEGKPSFFISPHKGLSVDKTTNNLYNIIAWRVRDL
jgi:hypothetical protein